MNRFFCRIKEDWLRIVLALLCAVIMHFVIVRDFRKSEKIMIGVEILSDEWRINREASTAGIEVELQASPYMMDRIKSRGVAGIIRCRVNFPAEPRFDRDGFCELPVYPENIQPSGWWHGYAVKIVTDKIRVRADKLEKKVVKVHPVLTIDTKVKVEPERVTVTGTKRDLEKVGEEIDTEEIVVGRGGTVNTGEIRLKPLDGVSFSRNTVTITK